MAKTKLTSLKAQKILKEGKAHGRKLTTKQKRYFGLIAAGKKPKKSKRKKG